MDKIAEQKSTIGKALCYIGWAIIILSALGFFISFSEIAELLEYGSELGAFVASVRIGSFFAAIAVGFIFFGMSEIIRLLGESLETRESSAPGKRFAKPSNLPKL